MIKVVPVPQLNDNYSYLVVDESTSVGVIIDVAEPTAVIAAVEAEKIKLPYLLTTHHHADHSAGNGAIVKKFEGITVVGGDERIPELKKFVGDGDTVQFGDLTIKVFFVPCHTRGHVIYYIENPVNGEPGVVFTGDTLFIGGCGYFFEGDGKQMHHALIEVISSLPDETLVYCGHEYTLSNFKFALSVDPKNPHLLKKNEWAKAVRESGGFTIPSSIGDEKSFNPFMRVGDATIKAAVGSESDSDIVTMTKLRETKNSFKSS